MYSNEIERIERRGGSRGAVLVLLGLLVVIGAILVSCTDNPGVRLRYEAEKRFFEAQRAERDASIQPQLITARKIDSIRTVWADLVGFCYDAIDSIPGEEYERERGELTTIAFRSASRVAQMFYRERRYDTCVSIMSQLIDRTNLQGASRISALINLGQALQSSGNWDSALVVYEYCVNTFYPPVDPAGNVISKLFNLPAHIFRVYSRINDTINARMQLDNAEFYYRDLIAEYPNTEIERAGRTSLTNLYESTGRWEEAIRQLEGIVDSQGVTMHVARQRIADIYSTRLGRVDTALTIYDELLAEMTGRDTAQIPVVLFKKAL
ncbi:tetratricopeptide repeat protein, partial [candidate division GN15 bacterium]|nr:tetratricopeptide repeat protein [candidate division GN15 bacterium]